MHGFCSIYKCNQQGKDMKNDKCPKGVNPEAWKVWKNEDRMEKVKALKELCHALFAVESLYAVASESDHPLEKAYELIYSFIESEGFENDI